MDPKRMSVAAPVVAQVRQCLDRWGIFPSRMVVAVSGGPDSVALLRALLSLRQQERLTPSNHPQLLVIGHFNHQLRGAESDADERFVRVLYESLLQQGFSDLWLECQRVDVLARAREEGNLESTARHLRYQWLTHLAQARQLPFVATGHTADDQAETVLHRLLRGSGLDGLRGIAARRPLASGAEVLRPILKVSRREILAYLESEGQNYRLDSSNADLRYTRNRIRHELLPYLTEGYNPAIAQILTDLAEQAAHLVPELQRQARAVLAEVEHPRAGNQLVLDQAKLAAMPRHQTCEVFRLLWKREGWPMGRMGFRQWDRLASLALGQPAALDLPGGIQARRNERVVLVGPGS
jgi:tRNA(Ile)-lysidine synthase